MEKINTLKGFLVLVIGGLGGMITNLFGGWTDDLTTLLIFMGVDFAMGLLIAAVWNNSEKSETGALSSVSAWKGLCRKGVSLLVVLVAHRLDVTLGVNYIKTAVIIAFIANEAISIVENLGVMGVPLPTAVIKAIDILKNRVEGDKS
ncbi:toxin secretion/phage lysis holin [Kineothrix alysoides]|uniref:Toxin secretion/phage lysis holin n=1 Tax=Kineothrix alysoides TaxID=1469948 RepID=A0A4R1R4Q4_9FIRM|nr:phage holin family protein [Kineothrix alysoides]TCL60408.1 toxin secretion/phage lysis holin [Kineothrix alysoides]